MRACGDDRQRRRRTPTTKLTTSDRVREYIGYVDSGKPSRSSKDRCEQQCDDTNRDDDPGTAIHVTPRPIPVASGALARGGRGVQVDQIVVDQVDDAAVHAVAGVSVRAPTITSRPSSSVSAMAVVAFNGVVGSPVVPITTIGPAPAPVIAMRGSSARGQIVAEVADEPCGANRGATFESCGRLRVGLVGRKSFGAVGAGDQPGRPRGSSSTSRRRPEVVRVVERQQTRPVTELRLGEGPRQTVPRRVGVHRPYGPPLIATSRFTGGRPAAPAIGSSSSAAISSSNARFGVTVVVELAPGIVAAPCEERRQRGFEALELEGGRFEGVGVGSEAPSSTSGAHRFGNIVAQVAPNSLP